MNAPGSWSVPTTDQIQHALDSVQQILRNEDAALRALTRYYTEDRFAGRLFLSLEPNVDDEITPTDLFAGTLLDIDVSAEQYRGLERRAPDLTACLRLLPTGPRGEIFVVDPDTWDDASALYVMVRECLGTNPWVTASKVVARKRPHLFPIRDRVVTRNLLRLGDDFQVDWQVYRAILADEEISDRLMRLLELAPVDIVDPPLKVLDAVLWMSAPRSAA